jgi:hypothetical protein
MAHACYLVHTMQQAAFSFQNRIMYFYLRPSENYGLPTPIFRKLTNARQNYVQVTQTKFYQNRTISVDSVDGNLFMPQLNMAFTATYTS